MNTLATSQVGYIFRANKHFTAVEPELNTQKLFECCFINELTHEACIFNRQTVLKVRIGDFFFGANSV